MWVWSVSEQRHIWIEVINCIWCEGPDNDCHAFCNCVCHAIAEGKYVPKN